MPRLPAHLLSVFVVAATMGPRPASAVLVVLTLWVVADLVRRSTTWQDLPRDGLLFVAIHGWKALTRSVAGAPRAALELRELWYRVPYAVVGALRIDPAGMVQALHVLFLTNSLVVVWALAQRFAGAPQVGAVLYDPVTLRLQGYLDHPNTFAGCVAIVLLVNVAVGLRHDRRLLGYSPVLAAGLLFSGSRGWLLGVAVAVVLLVALSESVRRGAQVAAVAVLVGVVGVLAVPELAERVGSAFDVDQNTYRLRFWEISWDAFREHPVTGLGGGMLPDHLVPFAQAGVVDNAAQGHSLYLQELAEGGVPGLVLVAGTHGYFLVSYVRRCRRGSGLAPALDLGVALAFAALVVEGVFDHNYSNAAVALHTSLAMGMAEAVRPGTRRDYAPARC